jgi:hypothetical protein
MHSHERAKEVDFPSSRNNKRMGMVGPPVNETLARKGTLDLNMIKTNNPIRYI